VALNVRKLGEVLKSAGLVDEYQLQTALSYQRNWGGRLGSCLIRLGYLNEENLADVLATQYQLQKLDLASHLVEEEALNVLPATTARKYRVMPLALARDGGARTLTVAIADPTNMHAIDDLQFITGCAITSVIATESSIGAAIDAHYELPQASIIDDLVALTEADTGRQSDNASAEGDRFLRLVRILHARKVLNDDDLESLLEN